MIKQFLNAVGIEVNIALLDWDSYMSEYYAGNYDIAVCETNYPPDLVSTAVTEGSEAAAQEIVDLQNAGVDEERSLHFARLQKIITDELVIFPLFFDMGVLLYNENISEGLSPTVNNIYNDIHLWRLK